MNEDSKGMIVILIAAVIAVAVIVSGLFIYSGMNRPLTVVESNSMQHSDDTSYLGIIDTGDMAVMVSPDKKSVTTFVEGHGNGYSKFGAYGDVIIYYRQTANPVIHRVIIWLDFVDGKWSAPSLKDYPADLWENEGTWDDLTGTLVLKNLPYKDSVKDISIDLNRLALIDGCCSGYLTKGDKNDYFDQNSSIHTLPVQKSELKAIAGLEIPWLGCIKLLVKDKNTAMIPDNSKTCLWILFIDTIVFIALVSISFEYYFNMKRRNAPTPSFPLEDEKGDEVTSVSSESTPCNLPEEQREGPS